ncbi:MAG TPA: hypothetical protein VNB94_12885 [Mycobacteriales bacterium]|nr:hypothetical protein [Mycobacteriales bacterium]
MTNASRCIVACTDDTGQFSSTVDAAIERAKESGATVILYDVAASSTFSSPRPTIWAGEGEAAVYDHPLDPLELEKLGRHDFALQVEGARQQGVDAYGWLPDATGGAALAEYAVSRQADLLLMPADIEPPDLIDGARGAAGDHLIVELVGPQQLT